MTNWMTTWCAREPPPFRGITPDWCSNKNGPLCRKAQNKTSYFEGRDAQSYLIVAGLCVMVHECGCMQLCNHTDQFQWRHTPRSWNEATIAIVCTDTLQDIPWLWRLPPKNPVTFKLDIGSQKFRWTQEKKYTFPDLFCITQACKIRLLTHLGQSNALTSVPTWLPNNNPFTYLRKTLSCACVLHLHRNYGKAFI